MGVTYIIHTNTLRYIHHTHFHDMSLWLHKPKGNCKTHHTQDVGPKISSTVFCEFIKTYAYTELIAWQYIFIIRAFLVSDTHHKSRILAPTGGPSKHSCRYICCTRHEVLTLSDHIISRLQDPFIHLISISSPIRVSGVGEAHRGTVQPGQISTFTEAEWHRLTRKTSDQPLKQVIRL